MIFVNKYLLFHIGVLACLFYNLVVCTDNGRSKRTQAHLVSWVNIHSTLTAFYHKELYFQITLRLYKQILS